MAVLVARTRARDVVLDGCGTVMDRCLDAGLPVASSCSGRGICGRCAMEVLEGADALTRTTARERRVLERNGHPPGTRLTCRCRVRGEGTRVVVRAGYW